MLRGGPAAVAGAGAAGVPKAREALYTSVTSKAASLRNPSHINSLFEGVYIYPPCNFVASSHLWPYEAGGGAHAYLAAARDGPCVAGRTGGFGARRVDLPRPCSLCRLLPLERSSGKGEKINTSIRSLHGLSTKFKYHALVTEQVTAMHRRSGSVRAEGRAAGTRRGVHGGVEVTCLWCGTKVWGIERWPVGNRHVPFITRFVTGRQEARLDPA